MRSRKRRRWAYLVPAGTPVVLLPRGPLAPDEPARHLTSQDLRFDRANLLFDPATSLVGASPVGQQTPVMREAGFRGWAAFQTERHLVLVDAARVVSRRSGWKPLPALTRDA